MTTLLAVVAPLSIVPSGLVHLSDASQTAEVGKLLAEHPDVAEVGPIRSPTTFPFAVRADVLDA